MKPSSACSGPSGTGFFLFRLQPRFDEERPNQPWLLPQAADRQVQFQTEFLQIQAHQIAHLHMLEVLPGAFDRVQVRGVG
ncbi:MAG: hypothetical protein WB773_14390, partial [Isosphaeraceae bacterium]